VILQLGIFTKNRKVTRYFKGCWGRSNQVEEDEVGRACGTNGGEEERV
jgi:hypothetical protein